MRSRLILAIALIVFGLTVTLAAADSLIFNTSDTDESHQAPGAGSIDGAGGAPAVPEEEVLGAEASSAPRADEPERHDAAWCPGGQRCERARRRDDAQIRAAELVGLARQDDQATEPCGDACVDQVVSLIPDVRERPLDLPTVRECTSSIGGEAVCFDFGDGNYLVGDGPADGEGELGFCTSSGYYSVSFPSPESTTGAACPDERGGRQGAGGEAPTAHDCTSSTGGEAVCLDFGDGKYLVIDLADGDSELGFCASSGYYYVTGPSGEGGAGADCPGLRARL